MQIIPFEEWFPLPLSFGSLLMLLVTFVLVMAGTVVGVIVKMVEQLNKANPRPPNFFSDENKLMFILGAAVSIGFWIANLAAVNCFFYATILKTGIGIGINHIMSKVKTIPAVAGAVITAIGQMTEPEVRPKKEIQKI